MQFMEYTPISPFMRPISHAHLRVVGKGASPAQDSPAKPVNKWQILRELGKASAAFGITPRDLVVLQGLLSFFPDDMLEDGAEMVVFPSNRTICERLNGMACSTMRRHLARLVGAGLLTRRDSPNGKRYARRHGDDRVAFGFDLAPLLARSTEIAHVAEAVRAGEERVRRLREAVSLMRRDLAALAEFGEEIKPGLGLWDQLRDTAALTARALRRKLTIADLEQLRTDLGALLDRARDVIDGPETEEMNTSAARNEQHLHNSKTDSIDCEQAREKIDQPAVSPDPTDEQDEPDRPLPRLPLHLITAACPALKDFYPGEIRHWHQLHDAACHIRPSMGISSAVWDEAQRIMGPEQAAIVLAAMLERFAEIRSPGAYLRTLTAQAQAGEFSCGPMVMALIGRRRAA